MNDSIAHAVGRRKEAIALVRLFLGKSLNIVNSKPIGEYFKSIVNKIDYMKRRLQTILVSKKLVSTPKLARQLITHKKVLVNGETVSSPSYLVPAKYEDKISLKINIKPKAEKATEKELEKNEATN